MTVAGLGFRALSSVASLRAALNAALAAAQAAHGTAITLTALVTAADKAAHPALLQLAAELQLPIAPIHLPQLVRQSATPSAHVPARYGAHSVAEAAALAAVGPAAVLLTSRCTSPDRMATAALASTENTPP
ncbi:MAG: cobalamin biosynthesis protein [Rhodoferax sp.]|uniref:cobalamin biosynthesis protein n=1 Tax=Rhodoferax sp. TaxID=50421 RepID=UPI003267D70C